MVERTDVLVVGGGPAGLAAALAARHRGFSVILADPATPPIDKACGEGLLPDSVHALSSLGVNIPSGEGFPFLGIRFVDHDHVVQARFPDEYGIGIRRTALHQILVSHAQANGVDLQWRSRLGGLCADGAVLNGARVRARWIVGADGGNSRVRRWSGLESAMLLGRRYSYRRHYRVRPWTDHVEVYWGRGFQIYVTPVGTEEICTAVVSRDPRMRLAQAMHEMPWLGERFSSALPTSTERGGVTSTLRLRRVWRGNVVLIGDASGSVDAITGQGLGLAFRQAVALADALAAEDLSRYGAEHRRLARVPSMMGAMLLALDRSSWLQRRAMRILSSLPQLFARLLAAHVGAASARDFLTASAALGETIP